MRHHVIPAPGIAAGAGPFLVAHNETGGGGCCSMPLADAPGLFRAPLDLASDQALGIRQHEYGHLGLARAGLVPQQESLAGLRCAGIHEAWIQGSLDVVVNHYMLARGNREIAALHLWQGRIPADFPRWAAAVSYLRAEGLAASLLMRMSLLARADFTPAEVYWLHLVGRTLAMSGAHAEPLAEQDLRVLLARLQRVFGPESREAAHSLVREPVAVELAVPGGAPGKWPRLTGALCNGWGEMEIREPPLGAACGKPGYLSARRLRPGFCGPFRFPHRALLPASDGYAFGLRKRIKGRSILIDCSGSMQIRREELAAILKRSPAATVAVYAGLSGDASGRLVVVARGGRHVDPEPALDGLSSGNVVDGPALEWLLRQPPSRIWISDGRVTGVGDRSAAKLNAEADRLVRAGRVRRVATLREFLGGAAPKPE